jgi:magnesium transporter
MREEAGKDYAMASGITGDVEASDNVWRLTRARVPWLLIGLLGGLFGSRVVGSFGYVLDIHPQLAFFMPLIAAMGGNVGIQSSAIVVQSLAAGGPSLDSPFRKLLKEFSVALLNATVLSVLAFAYNYIIGSPEALIFTVSGAMFSVVVFASLFGALVPLILEKIKIDPAVATGPFVTTLNDIIGMGIYLTIGTFFFQILTS